MKTKPIILLNTLIVILVAAALFYSGCKEDDVVMKDSELISFSHLQADNDSLYVGQTTDIKAVYQGKGVVFEWKATAGDILGSGEKIRYIVPMCALGTNTITCTAKAENTSITRSILIYVQ